MGLDGDFLNEELMGIQRDLMGISILTYFNY